MLKRNDIQFAVNHGTNYLQQSLAYRFDKPLSKPVEITLALTRVCPARCVMCDYWKMQPKDELTASEWIEFLGQMREWIGPFWVVLSGGEPFIKPGIFDILQFCRDNQIKTNVTSNGILLQPVYLDRILEHGPDFLGLSVDSPRAEVHDALRGTPGLHARCAEALHYLRERDKRIVLGVSTIIMEDNYRELPDLVHWALNHGVDRVLFQPLHPKSLFGSAEYDRDWYSKNPHWVQDADAFDHVVEQLLAMKRDGLPIWNDPNQLQAFKAYLRDPYTHPRPDECLHRYNAMNVDPQGNVNFCWILNDPSGNIRQGAPAEIWRSKKAQVVREKMRSCLAPCVLSCNRPRSMANQIKLFRFFMERQGT
jgi:MoaA/NifB/PqqE/SkfB family radical SAM enzyme